jgi:hypothetical protein
MRLRMYGYPRLAGVLGCTAALALAGCAANDGIAPTTGSTTSARVGSTHVPQYLPTRFAVHAVVPDNSSGAGVLTYYNGPVLLRPKAYLIFWGYKKYGDPDTVAPLLEAYFRSVGASSHNNIYTQYYDIVGSKTNYITNLRGQLGGVWFDDEHPVPADPTEAQIAGESLHGVSHFGYDANGSYVVATPHGRNGQGFGTLYCGYHNATSSGGNLVSYTDLPYVPDGGTACGADYIAAPKDESAADEGVTIVEGGLYGASITDPSAPSGWYNYQYGEISECPWTDVQNDPFGKKSYATGAMYSDATESCVQAYHAKQ